MRKSFGLSKSSCWVELGSWCLDRAWLWIHVQAPAIFFTVQIGVAASSRDKYAFPSIFSALVLYVPYLLMALEEGRRQKMRPLKPLLRKCCSRPCTHNKVLANAPWNMAEEARFGCNWRRNSWPLNKLRPFPRGKNSRERERERDRQVMSHRNRWKEGRKNPLSSSPPPLKAQSHTPK